MASSINASTSGAGGVITTADNSGVLNLQSGGVTVATISPSGIQMASNTAPTFNAYLSTNTTIGSGSQKVTYDAEEWDTNNNFASSKFTPTIAGYYFVCANVAFTGTSDSQMQIYKNGVAYKFGPYIPSASGNANEISSLVYCNGSTDYIEIYVYTTLGGTLSSGSVRTWFNGFLARSA